MEEVKGEKRVPTPQVGVPNIIGNAEDISEGDRSFMNPNLQAVQFGIGSKQEKGADEGSFKPITPKRTTDQEYKMQRRHKSKERAEK